MIALFGVACAESPRCPPEAPQDDRLTAQVADLGGVVCTAPGRESGVDPSRRFFLDARLSDVDRDARLAHLRVHVERPTGDVVDDEVAGRSVEFSLREAHGAPPASDLEDRWRSAVGPAREAVLREGLADGASD